MKNRRVQYLLIPALACLLAGLFPAAPESAAAEPACSELVTAKCTKCHSETRICQKVKKGKSEGAWKRTVKRMIGHGAEVNGKEKNQLITCLSTPDPSVRQLCTAGK